jgi:membrane glycosyltransferase
MDALTQTSGSDTHAGSPHPALPPEAPLDMIEQRFWTAEPAAQRPPTAPRMIALRRTVVFGGTIALTAAAAHQMYLVVTVNGLTVLLGAILALYVALFAWIAFSSVSAFIGFFLFAFGRSRTLGIDVSCPPPKLAGRCALLFPTYNETPARLMARVQTIYESIEQSGQIDHFEVFILSDTTDPEIWIDEEKHFLALRNRTHGGHGKIFYRHRYRNEGRKAGNIAEWVRRFGGRYDAMVVLDADSLMTADTIVRLVGALERNSDVALIQTLPRIVNANTLFARIQQFAGSAYGPLVAHGIAWWHGADGNYWGHNAVLRVRAFAAAAGLPTLPGRKPFGGTIMSHDFVEAALLRRRGWAVHMAPSLEGSYEESPPSLTDYAVRDRRWCQGNLQHMGVLPAKGLHWMSRLHLLTGIGSYLTAPMWLVFLLLGVLISLQAQFIRPDYFPSGFSLFPTWPMQDPVRAAWVFAGTMALLVAPKVLGFLALTIRRSERRAYGGVLRAFFSLFAETLISGLIAPVMMWMQSVAVLQVLRGRDSGWSAQQRDDASMPFRVIFRIYAWPTAAGIFLAATAYAVSLPLLLWMSPVILGLLSAVPLAALTSGSAIGQAARRLGLLVVPEEREPPEVLKRANELARMHTTTATGGFSAWRQLREDPELWAAHHGALPESGSRRPGEIDVDLVVGLAKLEQCDGFEEAWKVLSRPEKNALLANAKGLAQLQSLWDRRPDHATRTT